MKISRTLVMAEIAMSLVLLTGAGLLLKSFWHLLEVHPGFEPHHVVSTKLWLPVQNDTTTDPYRPPPKRAAFLQEVLRRVRQLPGVEEAAIGGDSSVPMGTSRFLGPFDVENRANESERQPVAEFANVSPDFFKLLRIRLLEGRTFRDDDDLKGQRVAIVNETLARQYWPSGAVGQRIRFGTGQTQNPWIMIVGMAEDVKTHGFDVANAPQIYQPTFQQPGYGSVVYARTTVEPGQLAELIRREVQSVNPDIPVYGVRTLDDVVSHYLAQRRFALELLGIFAGVAVLLASIGIYGVMAYTFSQRTNEIGIRMVLGANRSDILRMVVNEGSALVGVGLAAGLIGSILVTRFLQSMLFEVNATDPLTFGAVTTGLAAVAMAACVIPARRATRIEPLRALRYE
jgi:putative ABC transport system permease protein